MARESTKNWKKSVILRVAWYFSSRAWAARLPSMWLSDILSVWLVLLLSSQQLNIYVWNWSITIIILLKDFPERRKSEYHCQTTCSTSINTLQPYPVSKKIGKSLPLFQTWGVSCSMKSNNSLADSVIGIVPDEVTPVDDDTFELVQRKFLQKLVNFFKVIPRKETHQCLIEVFRWYLQHADSGFLQSDDGLFQRDGSSWREEVSCSGTIALVERICRSLKPKYLEI